jgi:MFS family permease
MIAQGYLYDAYIGGWSLFYVLFIVQTFFGSANYSVVGPYMAEIWPARLRASGMGISYGTGNLGKFIGPLGLSLIMGAGDVIKPAAPNLAGGVGAPGVPGQPSPGQGSLPIGGPNAGARLIRSTSSRAVHPRFVRFIQPFTPAFPASTNRACGFLRPCGNVRSVIGDPSGRRRAPRTVQFLLRIVRPGRGIVHLSVQPRSRGEACQTIVKSAPTRRTHGWRRS